MIKATDLRIGNIIFPREGVDELVTITDIDEDGAIGTTAYFDGMNGTTGTVSEAAQGIPLTPKWLEKCGFVKLWHLNRREFSLVVDDKLTIEAIPIHDNRSENIIVRLVTKQENDDENIDLGEFITYREIPCKSLHQLQNIYYALIGTELTIKEPA